MSYVNMILYSAVIPSYSSKRNKHNGNVGKTIRADDRRNKAEVKRFFDSIK